MSSSRPIYLIDGSSFIHRAFHAVRNLHNSRGIPTNAAFGFSNMLVKLMNDKSLSHAVVVFDAKGKTFRHEMFPDYKANRPEMDEALVVQLPYIKKITEGFGIPMMELAGYEADDIIGTLAKIAEREGFSPIMVTGDKDFIQLVTDSSSIWDPMKDSWTDKKHVFEKYGIEPHQMVDVQGFSGDPTDNIPGIPGIGPKTALDLVRKYGSMEGVYEHIGEITRKKLKERLVEYKDQAFLSRELARIRTDVPVSVDPSSFRINPPDSAMLSKIFAELEFRKLQQMFPVEADLSGKRYICVQDEQELKLLSSKLSAVERFALDTETTSRDPMRASLVGISVSYRKDEAFYIPCGHQTSEPQIPRDKVAEILGPVLADPGIEKIGQNVKYDWEVLRRHHMDLSGVAFDTMIASYLLAPGKRTHSLDQIAYELLDHRMISYDEVTTGPDGKKLPDFSYVPIKRAVSYACEDADITMAAYGKLAPELAHAGLDHLFTSIEIPLIRVLVKMEETGIKVDPGRLSSLSKAFADELASIERRIYELAGEEFNIGSSQQLGRILFDKLGLPVQKKTKKRTGYSTDVEVLTILSAMHDLPALILRHRSLSKLKSTYVDALFDLINPETGRIHTSFNQTVTATGRLSSSNPNLQNIPVRTPEGRDVRRAFIPEDGCKFLSADYSQVELRILAHYSSDPILISAFKNGEDVHTRTACEVFGVPPDKVTPELRRQAKVINFGIIYGMGAYSLAKELSVTPKMAQTYIDHYFSRYAGVKKFIDETIETAKKTGKVMTAFGRVRELPDINSKNRQVRSFAERIAVNTPIQGTAADIIKLAMIRADRLIEEKGLRSAMLLSVHDELLFEVPQGEIQEMKEYVREIMENIWEAQVPLKVNIAVGDDWAEAH